jgi:hypothetical protein
VKKLACALVLAAALLAPPALAASSLPARGVLTPGKSLGGIRIGMTMAQVKATWGTNYKLCPRSQYCPNSKTDQVWYFIYERGEPLGAGVRFRHGRVSAVFTLGSPQGWHTLQGLGVGQQIDKANELYGQLAWHVCIGYGAMSMRNGNTVTSIYTSGEAVYGFALTAPSEPICQ